MQSMTPILVDAPPIRGSDLRADLAPILSGGVALALICGFGVWFLSPAPPTERSIVAVQTSPPAARRQAAATRSLAGPSVANPYGALIAFAPPVAPPPLAARRP